MGPKIKIFRNWSPNKKLQDEICLTVQSRRITYARYALKNEPALKFRSCRRPEKKVGPKSKIGLFAYMQIVGICLIYILEGLKPPKNYKKNIKKTKKRQKRQKIQVTNKKLANGYQSTPEQQRQLLDHSAFLLDGTIYPLRVTNKGVNFSRK